MENIIRFKSSKGVLVVDLNENDLTIRTYGDAKLEDFLAVAKEIQEWADSNTQTPETLRKGESE